MRCSILKRLFIKGAKEHNLKNVDLELPRDKFIVFTGLSGSGKSSLAFDTIYAEGQRRYVESLSAYARQFLGQMEKPNVEYIEGLSPAISIDQKTRSHNPRSTVGTVTEIYDYLRLLYARIGIPHCPECSKIISLQTVDQMVDNIMELPEGTKIQMLAPVVRGRKGEHTKVFEDAKKSGFVRIRIDGNIVELSEDIKLEKQKKHNIEIVVDRIIIKPQIEKRIADSLETVLELTNGIALIDVSDKRHMMFSQNYACADCGVSIEELEPRTFSFNSPFGACPECHGLGKLLKIDPDLVIPDKSKSLANGAINSMGWSGNKDSWTRMIFEGLAKHYKFDINVPLKDISGNILDVILYGSRGEKIKVNYNRNYGSGSVMMSFEGVINTLERRYKETQSEYSKKELEELMTNNPCPSCNGARLKKESLAVTINEKNIDDVSGMSVLDAKNFFDNIELSDREQIIAHQILKEINARISFLIDVGLEYLGLSRASGSLSGGESQRIRLATQIGSGLVGVLYILDEPSIGLHQRDNAKLLKTLENLRDLGNTLIVVEHDTETMYSADHIVDIGPGAGVHGGEIVASGTLDEILKVENSITAQYLSGRKIIEVPKVRNKPNGKWIKIKNAKENNLRGINVDIPLSIMTCVTGVSGSGKSTLINSILFKNLSYKLNGAKTKPGQCDDIEGIEYLDKVIDIDQSPIGRTPRSNPATYTGVFDVIREVFSSTNQAKMKGYKSGRFSFNVKGGRCEACRGDGIIKIEMHFLPDVYVPCEVCKTKRYNRETLEVKYKDKSIADVLDMTIEDSMMFFENIPRIHRKLQTLNDVGLGYIKLGQPSTTLSGGEAQRVKLATELSKRSTGKTIYILDEPTTGLHIADVHRLIEILQKLTEGGNTVLIIEHNLDIIKTADYIIDLGPEGGQKGGMIVAKGTPEEVAKVKKSYTGQYLKDILVK